MIQKLTVIFSRSYEIVVDDTEIKEIDNLDWIKNRARDTFRDEFKYLDGSSDNFSAKIIINPKNK